MTFGQALDLVRHALAEETNQPHLTHALPSVRIVDVGGDSLDVQHALYQLERRCNVELRGRFETLGDVARGVAAA